MDWEPARLPQLGEIPGKSIDLSDVRLHYLDTGGDEVPVLLLHGVNQNVRQPPTGTQSVGVP